MKLENVELTIVFDKEDVTALNNMLEMVTLWVDSHGKSHGNIIENGLLPSFDKYQMKKVLDKLESFHEYLPGI